MRGVDGGGGARAGRAADRAAASPTWSAPRASRRTYFLPLSCPRREAAPPPRRAPCRHRREQAGHVQRPALHLARGEAGAARRLLQRDDERRRRAPARHRVPAAARAAASSRWSRSSTRAARPTICKKRKNRRKRQCRLPSAARVRARVQAVPQALPVRAHLRAVERDQPLHAADLAQPEGGGEVHHDRAQGLQGLHGRRRRHPRPGRQPARQEARRYRSTTRYIKAFRQARCKGPRTVCGVHNYSDVNRFRETGTKAIIKALGCKQIWLTEAGGIYKFAGFGAIARRQLKATKYMFKLARRNKRIKRVYVYTWFGRTTPALRRRPGRARPSAPGLPGGQEAPAEADACSTA